MVIYILSASSGFKHNAAPHGHCQSTITYPDDLGLTVRILYVPIAARRPR